MSPYTSILVELLAAIAALGEVSASRLATLQPDIGDTLGKRIEVVPNRGGFKDALQSLQYMYLKYGAQEPPKLRDAINHLQAGKTPAQVIDHLGIGNRVNRRNKGEVAAQPANEYNSFYISTLKIGTPPQSIPVLLDTGSSDFWLFTSETPPGQVSGNIIFNIDASSTAKNLKGETWSINCVDGSSASGNVYRDTVTAGNLTVNKQTVQSVQTTGSSGSEALAPASGVVGLAFSVLNTVSPDQQKTFWENALPQMTKPLFTVNFLSGKTGSVLFGDIDDTEYSGAVKYVPLRDATYWNVGVGGFAIGDGAAVPYPTVGAVDTGTSLLILPDSAVREYVSRLSDHKLNQDLGLLLYPCSDRLPSLTLTFGDNLDVTIPSAQMFYAQVSNETCVLALLPTSVVGLPESQSIIGGPLFRSQLVVFRGGSDEAVGFADKA